MSDWRQHGHKNTPSGGRRMRRGGGAPSFCWHCSKQLQRAPGKGRALFYYHVVTDCDKHEHRVHGDCLDAVINDGQGNTWLRP